MTSFWRIWASKYSRLLGEPGVDESSSLRGRSTREGEGESTGSMAAKIANFADGINVRSEALRQARRLSDSDT